MPLSRENVTESDPPRTVSGMSGVSLDTRGRLLSLTGAALLARHNLRLERGDRKGARRLAYFFFLVAMLSSISSTHHLPTLQGEFTLLINELAFNLMATCLLWLVYIAVEPFVRRRWPGRIISWNRLLAGDWRDPLDSRFVIGINELLFPHALRE